MARPLTAQEAAVVRRLLDNAPVGDISSGRERPLEELRVVPANSRFPTIADLVRFQDTWS